MSGELQAGYEGYAIVEQMGHVRTGAFVRETTLAGAGVLRLDIPGDREAGEADPLLTQFVAPTSIYRLTPCDEATARAVARHNRPEPVMRWELPRPPEAPRALPAARLTEVADYYEPDSGHEYEDDPDDDEAGL